MTITNSPVMYDTVASKLQYNSNGTQTDVPGIGGAAAANALVGTTIASNVIASSLIAVDTITTGVWHGTTVGVGYGGTGQTSYTDGQLLIGNTAGNTLAKATLTAGANITITNGAGAITIASTGGGGSTANVFNVVDYGADPTGASSSQTAFANAIAAAKSSIPGPSYQSCTKAATVFVPKGIYKGITTLDCTNVVGLVIEGQGSWGSAIYADSQSISYPILDFSGSAQCQVNNLGVFGMNYDGTEPSIHPQVGILLADSTTNTDISNKNSISNVYVDGWFAKGALVGYRTTNNNYFASVFSTRVTNCPVITMANSTYVNTYTSAYTTLNSSGGQINENNFFGCESHNAHSATPTVAGIILDGAVMFNWHGGIVDGSGTSQPMVWFLNSQNNPKMIGFVNTKFYTESAYPASTIFVAAAGVTVDKLTCWGSWKDGSYTDKSTGAGASFTNWQFNGSIGTL